MNICYWAARAGNHLARFTQLQLFITLFSLPILICWGLPLSLLSPLGNLIFGPALTLFLFLSSLIFFSELFHIPNGLLITALETTTVWWLRIMHADTHTWLIGFAKPHVSVLILFTLAAVVVMLNRKTNGLGASIGCFSALMVGLCLYVRWGATPSATLAAIACNKGQVTIMATDGAIIVVDPGYMGQKISAASWAQYTLIPELIKATGKNSIDHLIALQPGGMLFEALEKLCTKIHVCNVYLPFWQGEMKPSALHRYGAFMRAATAHQTTIHRIARQPIVIKIGKDKIVTIEPMQKTIKNLEISYPAYAIHTRIDNEDITLYSARYTKKNVAHMRQSHPIKPKIQE